MTTPDFQRIFSMGAFEALRTVRIGRKDHPTKQFYEIVEIVSQVQSGGAAYDYEAANHLNELVNNETSCDDATVFYRECIKASIMQHRPVWMRTIPLGRKKFSQKLQQDENQCFASAGLLEDDPSESVINWWDLISSQTRTFADNDKLLQARKAEKLSLEHEKARIRSIGLDRVPIWMAIEDNTAGYDILSYDLREHGAVNRVLEVKSTVASPLRFFVTRNEWETCNKMGDAYHFHIWDMKTGNLFERKGSQIAAHVPTDQGNGRWSNVEIKLGGS